MGKLVSQIIAGIAGLWLAVLFLPEIQIRIFHDSDFFGIPLTARWHVIVLLGIVFGLVNLFLRPVLKTITLPLRIITLGAFSFAINIVLIWAVDLIFKEITIPWFWPLLWTTIIIWALNILLPMLFRKGEPSSM